MKRFYVGLTVFACAAAIAGEPDACDLAAAHPSDPDRAAPGVPTAEVVTHVAIPACRAAVAREPDNSRFRYQLGRALVYWAGANGASSKEGLDEVKTAADGGYRQAQFVYGYLLVLDGDACAAQPYYQLAADQGLKSARITYVSDVLAGRFAACGVRAAAAEMQAYLDAATAQVNGYYENLLLGNLKQRLKEH